MFLWNKYGAPFVSHYIRHVKASESELDVQLYSVHEEVTVLREQERYQQELFGILTDKVNIWHAHIQQQIVAMRHERNRYEQVAREKFLQQMRHRELCVSMARLVPEAYRETQSMLCEKFEHTKEQLAYQDYLTHRMKEGDV